MPGGLKKKKLFNKTEYSVSDCIGLIFSHKSFHQHMVVLINLEIRASYLGQRWRGWWGAQHITIQMGQKQQSSFNLAWKTPSNEKLFFILPNNVVGNIPKVLFQEQPNWDKWSLCIMPGKTIPLRLNHGRISPLC